MALEKVGKRVYQYIDDCPEINENRSGDKILVNTTTGPSLLDFDNLTITLDQCTFKQSIVALLGDDGNPITDKIGADTINVDNLPVSAITTLSAAVNQLNKNDNTTKDTITEKHNETVRYFMAKHNSLIDKINEIIGVLPEGSGVLPIPEEQKVSESSIADLLLG